MSLLELRDVDAGYGEVKVLHGVDLTLPASGRLALIGRNGVGKSTTLKAIMGLATIDAGTVWFDGVDITAFSPQQRALLGIGYVPQTRDIFASLSVEENLVAGLKDRPRSALEEAYAMFPRLKERRANGGTELSGGEQQMLTVARTLLGRPKLLLLDEPLEGLAPIICQELMQVFETLAAETGVAVLLVEQKVDEALRFAHDVLLFEKGSVVHRDTADGMRAKPALIERHVGVADHA